MQAGINFKNPKNLSLLKEHCSKFSESSGISLDEMSWTYQFQKELKIGERATLDLEIDTMPISWKEREEMIEANQPFIVFLELVPDEECNDFYAVLFEPTVDSDDTWTFKIIKASDDPSTAKACFEFVEEGPDSLDDFWTLGFELTPFVSLAFAQGYPKAQEDSMKLWKEQMAAKLTEEIKGSIVCRDEDDGDLEFTVETITKVEVDDNYIEEFGEGYDGETNTVFTEGYFECVGTCLNAEGVKYDFKNMSIYIDFNSKELEYTHFSCDTSELWADIEKVDYHTRRKEIFKKAASNMGMMND